MEKNHNEEEANELVHKFKRTFFTRFGVEPIVKFNLDIPYMGRISMIELADAVNQALNKHMYFDGSYATIFSRTRKRPVVYYRHAFCRMAVELRFQCGQIAKYLDMNHSSVIHSSRLVKNLLEIKDPLMTVIMNNVKESIKDHVNNKPHGDIIQENN